MILLFGGDFVSEVLPAVISRVIVNVVTLIFFKVPFLFVSPEKFSRHLIIHIPGGAFKDNSHAGAFVGEVNCAFWLSTQSSRALQSDLEKSYHEHFGHGTVGLNLDYQAQRGLCISRKCAPSNLANLLGVY